MHKPKTDPGAEWRETAIFNASLEDPNKIAQNNWEFLGQFLRGTGKDIQGQRRSYYDAKGNGLHVVVTHQGQKSFYIRRRVGGRNEKHRLGAFPDSSVEQARDKAARFAGAVAFGENPSERRRMLRGELSLAELFEEYLQRHLKKSRKTWSEYEKQFRRYFGDWLDRKLSSISQTDVERRHGQIARDRGTYSANRALQLVRAMYNKGLIWRLYSGSNPATGITMFEERTRERVLQADEFKSFFEKLEDEQEDFRDFILLTLLTGARKYAGGHAH